MTDWQHIQGEGWERFCFLIANKTLAVAVDLARKEGMPLPEAVNEAIEQVAKGIEDDGAPPGLADAYREQYRADRANQLKMAALWLEQMEGKPKQRRKRAAREGAA